MDRNKAMQNLYRVMQRIRNINGIFATPLEKDEFVKIKKVWLFGSLAKGSDNPNDIDIFIELNGFFPDSITRYLEAKVKSHERKSRRKVRRMQGLREYKLHGGFKNDKNSPLFIKNCLPQLINSDESLCTYLNKGTPSVSIHFIHEDMIFDKLDVKHLLYPRCDFDFESGLSKSYKKKYQNIRKLP